MPLGVTLITTASPAFKTEEGWRKLVLKRTGGEYKGGGWMFKSYDFIIDGKISLEPIPPNEFERMKSRQQTRPVLVMSRQQKGIQYWWYQGDFYKENEGLSSSQVKALLEERKRKKKRKIERAKAKAAMGDDEERGGSRSHVPKDVRIHVWRRDEGQCVECGSQENLEFDHIIPVSMGGSDTARNIQLLCETCNREKGASLT